MQSPANKNFYCLTTPRSAERVTEMEETTIWGRMEHINNRAISSQEDIRHTLLKARKLH